MDKCYQRNYRNYVAREIEPLQSKTGQPMKIAFVVSFFDFRNDVRRVIATASARHKVIVMGKAEEEEQIRRHLPGNVGFRAINERTNSRINKLWEIIYFFCRALPKSRDNFFLMELFKASNTPLPTQVRKNLRRLHWIKLLPKFVAYDTFLKGLRPSRKTRIDDIDQFVFFTAIADDYLLSRLIQNHHPSVKVYVYSWDHPCKHTCFSGRVKYAVWNSAMANDISALQKVDPAKITITGASQLGYIEEYLRIKKDMVFRSFSFPYIYFGCAVGIERLIPDEIDVIRTISAQMKALRQDLTLVVRPYPVQSNWKVYECLRELDNIHLDEEFRTADLSVSEAHLMEKFEKVQNAEAFFHLGTTLGLEACFTDTPAFIIDMGYDQKKELSLFSFIHQYQNDRHLINLSTRNLIQNEETLRAVLTNPGDSGFLQLNFEIRKRYPVLSFEKFTHLLTEHP